MSKYIEKRRRRWYVKLEIPKSLRPIFNGKPRFFRSLETESQTEAERRAPIWIAHWKAEIENARTGTRDASNELRRVAYEWRDALDDASPTEKLEMRDVLAEKAEAIESQNKGAGVAIARIANRIWIETGEHVEPWLATLDNEPKTIDMKRSDLARFCARMKLTKHVNRKAVLRWTHDLQYEDGLRPGTIRRIISAARGYWEHLIKIGVVDEGADPFRKVVAVKPKSSKSETARKRRGFTSEDVVRLLSAAINKGDLQLARLLYLEMWTGCRIEELCSLEITRVSSDRFTVDDAKSEAGWREVPIHSHLAPLVDALKMTSTDGYLLSGLSRNKYSDRSNAVGKRFGHLKKKLGFGPQYVFHSIRKTVTTQFDAAQVPEAVTARIVGHDIPTMTYGLYSAGAPFDVKRDAVEKLSYPNLEAARAGLSPCW